VYVGITSLFLRGLTCLHRFQKPIFFMRSPKMRRRLRRVISLLGSCMLRWNMLIAYTHAGTTRSQTRKQQEDWTYMSFTLTYARPRLRSLRKVSIRRFGNSKQPLVPQMLVDKDPTRGASFERFSFYYQRCGIDSDSLAFGPCCARNNSCH
jgi:hypothetical protein